MPGPVADRSASKSPRTQPASLACVWSDPAPKPKPGAPGGAELAGTRLQLPEDSAGATALPAQPALDLLLDRSQISRRRRMQKHGAEYRRQWRKVHLGIDVNTLEIRASD